MSIIEKQLTKYYKKRGMKGPILRACVKHDLARLWHYYTKDLDAPAIQDWNKRLFDSCYISQIEVWKDTKEGDAYWRVRDRA